MIFIGRKTEVHELRHLWQQEGARLSVVYGRRRVGKTRLIEETFAKERFLRFEGLENASTAAQKQHFVECLADQTARSEYRLMGKGTWKDILIALSNALGSTPTVVLLDEFQWIAAGRSELVSQLKYVWDNYFIKNNIHLILCGSISSFLVKKVLRSRALYGRASLEMNVQPLRAPDFVSIYHRRRSLEELVEFFLMAGGVPEYLKLYDPDISTRLNIQQLAFAPNGYMVGEFERLFASHFGTNPHYERVLRFLATRRFADRETIQKSCGLNPGGRTSGYLEELELAGFIEKYAPLTKGDSSKLVRFRIIDPYLLFYFRFIRPNLTRIRKARKVLPLTTVFSDQTYTIWRGLAFEHLCYLHADLIAERAGFGAVRYRYGTWFRRKDKLSGAQIDLLYARADNVLTLCEIKFRDQKIGRDVIGQVEKKVELLEKFERHTIERVLITVSDVTQDLLNEGYFTRILRLQDLFR